MAKVGYLSSSKITTYKGCPMAYLMKYVLHEKVAQNIRLAFGKVIHDMLLDFYRKNFQDEEKFANSWAYRWRGYCAGDFLRGKEKERLVVEEYPMKIGPPVRIGNHITFGKHVEHDNIPWIFLNYLREGKKILKSFYLEFKSKPPPVIKEQEFKLEVFGHPNAYGLRRKHKLKVIFDRVDIFKDSNGEWQAIISDYKTDSGDPSGKGFYIHRHPQFTLYSYAFRQLIKEGRLKGIIPDNITKESAILYFHMREGKIIPTYRDEIDFDYVRSLMDDVAEGILCNRFTPFYGFHCNLCEYQVPCEKYSMSHDGPRIVDLEDRIKEARVFDWEEDFQRFLRGKKKERPTFQSPRTNQLEFAFKDEIIPSSFKQSALFKRQRATGLLVPRRKFN